MFLNFQAFGPFEFLSPSNLTMAQQKDVFGEISSSLLLIVSADRYV